MRKIGLVKTISMSLLLLLISQVDSTNWERMFGGIHDEEAYSLKITNNKDYIITGYSEAYGSYYYYFYTLKVESNGDLVWQNEYGRGGGYDIIPLDDGDYLGLGYSSGFTYCFIKINSYGDSLWKKTYERGTGAKYGSIIEALDGGFIMVWIVDFTEHDILVAKIDSVGDTVWTRAIGRVGNDHGYSISKTFDNNYLIVGDTYIAPENDDVYIVKINYIGEILWDTTYGGIGLEDAYSVCQTYDSCYIVAGRSSLYYSILFDVYLLKINEDGDTLWTRKIGSDYESDIGRCVKQTYDGGYIITGYTYSYGPGTPDSSNVYLIKTDSEGYVEWERTYGGTGEDKGYSVSQTEDGGYIIAGVYDQGPHTDVYLIKTDSLGETEWIREVPTKPQEFSMNVYPNPFNSTCKIIVAGSGLQVASLEIFDINGRKVGELERSPVPQKSYSFAGSVSAFERPGSPDPRFPGSPVYSWQPDNKVTSGVYLVRVKAGKEVITKKIIYLK